MHNCTQFVTNYSEPSVLYPKKPQRSLQGRFARENIFSTNVNVWLFNVLSSCRCVLVSIQLGSKTHTHRHVKIFLQLVKQNRAETQWVFTGETNTAALVCMSYFVHIEREPSSTTLVVFALHVGKTYRCRDESNLSHRDAPRLPRIYTSLCIEVKNAAGDGDRQHSSTVSVFHLRCTKKLLFYT